MVSQPNTSEPLVFLVRVVRLERMVAPVSTRVEMIDVRLVTLVWRDWDCVRGVEWADTQRGG